MNDDINKDVPSFLSYLQKRMDFIAQVATSAPSWCMVTSCDELIDHFNKQACLIKNIIRSHQGVKDGPNFEPQFEKRYDVRGSAPDIDIPHGQVGVQAFYTILENLVRNTAKYGDTDQLNEIKDAFTGDGKLNFKISVRDQWDAQQTGWARDFYQVKIIDPLRVGDDSNFRDDVVTNLNNFLSEPLTDPATGVVMPKHWGMKEIKICAAYLRMVKQDQIDLRFAQWDGGQDSQQPPIIKVSLEPLGPAGGPPKSGAAAAKTAPCFLTYTLYLLRPKKALVIMPSPAPEVAAEFRRAGIDFHTPDHFKAEIDKGWSPRHSYLVLSKPPDEGSWNWLSTYLNALPPRVIILDATEADIPEKRAQLKRSVAFMPTPALDKPAALIDKLAEHWVRRWWDDFEIVVRWSLHNSTVAQKGIGSDSDWQSIPAETQRRWLVFDHSDAADQSPLYRTAAYHEGFTSSDTVKALLEKRGTDPASGNEVNAMMLARQSMFRIREAAGLSVAIIDERVWLERDGLAKIISKYNKASATTRLAVWQKRRVFIQDTNQALDDFEAFVNALTPPDRDVFDFIIIHQGIIDGVKDKLKRGRPAGTAGRPSQSAEGAKDKIRQDRFTEVWKKLRAKARWLIIDSGRGQPEQARADNLRWVEYSNLAECLIQESGDKFRLAELLWTLRASSRYGATT